MLTHLDRKVVRDLGRMKGQAVAVSLVMACGLAMLVMARSLIHSLDTTRREYYEAHRFAEVFAQLKRAPEWVAGQVAEVPGVARVEAGISVQVTLDLAGVDEPASGTVRSVPDAGLPELNRLYLRSGRWLAPGVRGEVLVGEAFAEANGLGPGSTLVMLLNGRRQVCRIAGVVLSPEYIFESRPGAALPDHRTYGTFWMAYRDLAAVFDLEGGFNAMALKLAPGGSERAVIAAVDRRLEPYGGRGAYGRKDHPSHIRVSDEIRVLETLSIGFPLVFLSVAAFMTNAVIARLVNLQREQIAVLKAFGFTNGQVALHYLKFALVLVLGGSVVGVAGGVVLGQRLVGMYHLFFRFPDLTFRLDETAVVVALGVGFLAALAGVWEAVRRAERLPPAQAMRPEPPASYRPALLERTGVARWLSHTFRIAVRNIERRPLQALFTVVGLALATGIMIIPNCFRDGVKEILGFQWDVLQRHDMDLGLVEPAEARVGHLFAQLPGVVSAEPVRMAAVRLHFGSRSRRLVLRGLAAGGLQNRVLDGRGRVLPLSPHGLVVSEKLAEVLGARVGEEVQVEFLEGRRRVVRLPLVGLARDFAGMSAYMDLAGVNRLMGDGEVVTGASFTVDGARRGEFLRALKGVPRVSSVAIKTSLRANFEQTTAASISLIQGIYLIFATVVAFGVVYNSARISLAERARELATLRVIGFSQREVGAVLVTELVVLAVFAVPLGLGLGTVFARAILGAVNTETVRVPLVLTASNYAFAVTVVAVASLVSALAVLRRLKRLNLVGALRAPE